jgi:hypothetical protein
MAFSDLRQNDQICKKVNNWFQLCDHHNVEG